jgi:hypothetical protein
MLPTTCMNHGGDDGVPFQIHRRGIEVVVRKGGEPYQLWLTDLWKCPACGIEILAGFFGAPLMERGQDGFREYLDRVSYGEVTDSAGRTTTVKGVIG